MKEAGWEDRNGDGVIERADGTPFRFKLTFKSGDEFSKKLALFLKDSYSPAGIVASAPVNQFFTAAPMDLAARSPARPRAAGSCWPPRRRPG